MLNDLLDFNFSDSVYSIVILVIMFIFSYIITKELFKGNEGEFSIVIVIFTILLMIGVFMGILGWKFFSIAFLIITIMIFLKSRSG